MKKFIRQIALVVCVAMALTVVVSAESTDQPMTNVNTETYQNCIDRLLTTQYDALVTSDYSGIDALFATNDITSFYCSYLKYRVDAAFESENYWLDYNYEWKRFDASENGNKISFSGEFDLGFTYASALEGAQSGVLISGEITVSPDGMRISDINTNEMFYMDLKDNLISEGVISVQNQVPYSNDFAAASIPVIAAADTQRVALFLEDMLEDLKSDRSMKHIESIEVVSSDPVIARASYDYSVSKGVNYANKWYNQNNTSIFKPSAPDCTNFVSQCVWAAYGEKMESSSTISKWFAHTNGAGAPWENVDTFWKYATSRTGTQTGPRASGINNGGSYTEVPAYGVGTGEVLQFEYGNSTPEYDHSVYVVTNNATAYNNYGGVIFAQHSGFGKFSVQDKINSYGSKLKMRRMIFTTAQF